MQENQAATLEEEAAKERSELREKLRSTQRTIAQHKEEVTELKVCL